MKTRAVTVLPIQNPSIRNITKTSITQAETNPIKNTSSMLKTIPFKFPWKKKRFGVVVLTSEGG